MELITYPLNTWIANVATRCEGGAPAAKWLNAVLADVDAGRPIDFSQCH